MIVISIVALWILLGVMTCVIRCLFLPTLTRPQMAICVVIVWPIVAWHLVKPVSKYLEEQASFEGTLRQLEISQSFNRKEQN